MSLEDEEGWPVQPFTYAFHSLAVCAGGGHVKRRRVIRLLEFINQSRTQTHDIGMDEQMMRGECITNFN